MLSKLRKSPSQILHASLIIGLILSTTPIIDGCSRGQESVPAPAPQPGTAPPPAAQQPAPGQAPPAAPNPAAPAPAPPEAAAPPPGPAAVPPGGAAPTVSTPQLATPEQLQQLVSPIALYPDMLIAQILAASTYPTQVVEAERFIQQNSSLSGDALANAVNPQPWDPSVRSLCQFPSVVGMMNQNLSWTQALGQAYYVQPQDVMHAIQVMRRRAMQAGTLKSTAQQKVVMEAAPPGGGEQPQVVVIQPTQPNTVYVPNYNPSTVYGAPVALPQGYTVPPSGYSGTEMLVAGVVGFGAGMLLSSLINNGSNNWGTNWYGGNVVYNRNIFVSNSPYWGQRYPGYRPPGYPPYPGYPGYRPGYPGYPNRPGYPGYPGYANRPGYPAYPNRPGYPAYPNRPGYPGYANRPGYPPKPVPYTGKLAATNPNLKSSSLQRQGKQNLKAPVSNYGTNKTGTKYKANNKREGTNMAAIRKNPGKTTGGNFGAAKGNAMSTRGKNFASSGKNFKQKSGGGKNFGAAGKGNKGNNGKGRPRRHGGEG